MKETVSVPVLLELIKNNIVQYGNPLGLTGKEINAWSKELNLPVKGDILLYTGGEYQLLPYLDSLINAVSHFDTGGTAFSTAVNLRNLVGRLGIPVEKLYGKVMMSTDGKRYQEIPQKAAIILRQIGVEICILAESELYSGALLQEFGFIDEFKVHAKKLMASIKETGARAIICLSPHSAEVFKFYYPEINPWFANLRIYTLIEYLYHHQELLQGLPTNKNCSITIHDSCRIARELNFNNEIRDFFEKTNVKIRESEHTGCWTICCGGPSKMIFPKLADALAAVRLEELLQSGAEEILVFCPYCLAAFEKVRAEQQVNIKVTDIVEFLSANWC